jgi:hypothetical protein
LRKVEEGVYITLVKAIADDVEIAVGTVHINLMSKYHILDELKNNPD